MRTRSLIGNMVFGGFPKKISNKTFYFHSKKKITLFLFYLVLALESISGVKRGLFGPNTPEYKFQSKTVKLSYFTLEKSIFFIFNQCFFHSYQSCPMLRGVTEEKQKKQSLIGNMVFFFFFHF
jgi:hypothetical protein